MRRLFDELRKRSVIKVALAYLVVGWVVMQVADVMFPALGLPEWSITLVAALLIIGFPLALILAWAYELTPSGIRRDERDKPEASGQRDPVVLAAADDNSIAVLPFADMSVDHDNEYFSDGVTEELLNALARVGGLRVSSRTSCFAFKGKDVDIPTVARKLNVAHVLEGSVRKSGNHLRISAQLIKAATDSNLWSDSYDRELDDIFVIQADIAQKIVSALRVKIDSLDLPYPTTGNAKAYDFYLRGRDFFNKFGSKTVDYAIDMFKRATEIDSKFARAWSGLGDAHAIRAVYYGGTQKDVEESNRASKHAVELAPNLSESHISRGISHLAGNEFEPAAAAFKRAIALDPKNFDAYYHYARTCFHMGDMRQAIEWFEKAAAINPDDYQGPLIAASIYRDLGNEAKAAEAERRGVELAEKHLTNFPDTARAYYLALGALDQLGQREKAIAWAERAIAIDPDDEATMYNLACFYVQIEEVDRALACLEKAHSSLTWMQNDPDLDAIRDDPRFQTILQRFDSDSG